MFYYSAPLATVGLSVLLSFCFLSFFNLLRRPFYLFSDCWVFLFFFFFVFLLLEFFIYVIISSTSGWIFVEITMAFCLRGRRTRSCTCREIFRFSFAFLRHSREQRERKIVYYAPRRRKGTLLTSVSFQYESQASARDAGECVAGASEITSVISDVFWSFQIFWGSWMRK